MKRVPMPPRRRPLRPGKPPIRRTPLSGGGQLRRTASRRRPTHVEQPGGHRTVIRAAVFARDHRCRLAGSTAGPCFGGLTVHHLRKASQQGPYTLDNLVALCAGHNDWIETSPAADLVDPWGLRIRAGGTQLEAWALMQMAGLVDWWPDGSPAAGPPPLSLAL